MANLDRSWQESVIKLAQAGNLRAIAFWLNRYLVPQGMCAQVMTERPGHLWIRVACRRPPERERLVRFICHRLYKLQTDKIQQARITAEVVGSSNILWEKSVHFFPTAPTLPPNLPPSNPAQPSQPLQASAQSTPFIPLPPQTPIAPAQVVPQPSQPPRPPKVATPSRAARPVHPHLKPRTSTPLHQTPIKRKKVLPKSPSAPAIAPPSILHVKIKDQPQSDRLLLLTGVVIAAFLVGLSLALLNQVILPILFRGEAVRLPRFGPVQTAVGEVSVIKPPVLHPGDGTITLMFGPMAALGQAPSTGVQLYQQTDVVMTSLQGGWANSAPTQETEEASTSENGSNTQTLSNGTLQELRANGVDLVMMTGSHPPLSAIEQLQQNSIYAVGTGISPEAPRRPVILEVKGKRIAYLGYSDATLQTETENAVGDRQLKHQLSTDIRALRDQVDWIVVGYDWSQPLKTYPEVWQTDLTRFAIDQGADLVVGYRPEAMQGAEIYQGRPIVYSLGNSVGYAQSQSSDRDTVMLKVSLQGQQMQLEFVPIQVIQGQPTIATGEVGQQILSYLQQTSSLFDQPLRSPFVLDTRNSAASAPAPLLVPPAVSPPFTQ